MKQRIPQHPFDRCAGLAALQAAVDRPDRVRGVQLIDISIRMLHIRNQQAWKRPFVKALQNTLRGTPVGSFFFQQVRCAATLNDTFRLPRRSCNPHTRANVRSILNSA